MNPTSPASATTFVPVDPATIAHVIERASSAGFGSWWGRVTGAGYCAAPVHLAGRDRDGARAAVFGRCKNRRAAVCPSCSDLYAGDTWHLVHAGIEQAGGAPGGRGHPIVFATLTAPSFGPVHTTHRDAHGPARRCHPNRRRPRCEHGQPAWCTAVHGEDDTRLGESLCLDCYDYRGHVLFTWHAPELWHRFTITLRRLVRRRLRDCGEDPAGVRVSYVKVVELQRRGVPHFHAVIRLDAADTATEQAAPPPSTSISSVELGALVRQAASSVHLDVAGAGGEAVRLQFGAQADVQPLRLDADHAASGNASGPAGRRVAGYLAKYVTKSVAEYGLSPRRLSVQAIDRLDLSEHVRAILHTIVELAALPEHEHMIDWLHTLGYRGHVTSKTRRYSTTMIALRARRESWRRRSHARGAAPEGRGPTDGRPDVETTEWRFDGSGHANAGDRLLAISAAVRAREARLAGRDALSVMAAGDDADSTP